jgi:thiol-disulfide isomerase/thioredoxin
MKFMVFYREQRDYTRATKDLLEDLGRQYQKSFDHIDPDTPSGVEKARVYDIMDFPTFLVTTDSGQEVTHHTGLPLPTVADLASMFASGL